MSTFTDEIFGMVCYTVSSKHNPREGVFCYETRENLEIHVLFRGAGADFVRCASRAHRCPCCTARAKSSCITARFATYGLYLFCLTAAALLLYAVWLWIAEAVKKKQIACTMVLAVCLCAFLAAGYQDYHAEVYRRSTVSAQKKYQLLYEKGLFYDLKGLFR